jgi:Cytochrome c oxidase subunit IV
MKTNAKLFLLLTVFYLVDAAAYGIWSYIASGSRHEIEVIGTAAIGMLVFLSGFIFFYVNSTARTVGVLPEDRLDANTEDADAEVGFFAPWSWWPFALGLFASIVFASLAVGWWLTFVSVPLALVALIGLVFEFSRGQYAH